MRRFHHLFLPILLISWTLPAAPGLAAPIESPQVERRIERQAVELSREQLQERLRLGKLQGLDLETGRILVDHVVDSLPADWAVSVDDLPQDVEPHSVDSHGCPIVSRAAGWPDWAQHDVDALRDEISQAAARVAELPQTQRGEAEDRLGNFVGQALVRGVALGDRIDLDRLPDEMPVAARSAVEQMRFYETVKAMRLRDAGEPYAPTVHSPEALDLVRRLGGEPADLRAADSSSQAPRKISQYSLCYGEEQFARGMTYLSGATQLWNAVTGPDDGSADIPLGFDNFYGYACLGTSYSGSDLVGNNSQVRLSSNGYVTLFQQETVFGRSPGALAGTQWQNDRITDETDPDGYLAPSWDDYDFKEGTAVEDQVRYKTEGSIGQRVFTAEWASISHHQGQTSELDYHTFQLKLFEATGNVEFHYLTTWGTSDADSATVGLENFDGLRGNCGPNCGNDILGDDLTHNYRFVPRRPANNELGSASCLRASGPSGGSLYGATRATPVFQALSFDNDLKDVWYSYRAPADATVTFDACEPIGNVEIDTTMTIFEVVPFESVTVVAENRNGCSSTLGAKATVDLQTGDMLAIRMAGNRGAEGKFRLNVTPDVPFDLQWDTYDDPHPLAASGSAQSSTTDNSGCGRYSSFAGDTVSEWHSYTPAQDGPVYFSTCEPAGVVVSGFDTTVNVFAGIGSGYTSPTGDADDDPACASNTSRSTLVWDADAGHTYLIRVGGKNGLAGDYYYEWGPVNAEEEEPIFADGFESGTVTAWN